MAATFVLLHRAATGGMLVAMPEQARASPSGSFRVSHASNAPGEADALAVQLGMKAIDDEQRRGALPPDEADRLAVEEIRAVRKSRRGRAS
jgi:hypothetical protein